MYEEQTGLEPKGGREREVLGGDREGTGTRMKGEGRAPGKAAAPAKDGAVRA